MDQELKQRLIGAVVITAMAAIFVPMLFDDPVEERGQVVDELTLPDTPVKPFEATAERLPPVDADVDSALASIEQSAEKSYLAATASPDKPEAEDGFEPEPDVPEPVFTPEPAAEPAVSTEVPESKANGWLIQLGSFSEKENAFALRDKIVSQHLPAFVDEVEVGGEKSYRLVVGPERDKGRAQVLQGRLDRKYHTKSLLLAADSEADSGKPAATDTKTPLPVLPLVRWYIQLGSFSKSQNAYALRDKLRAQGFPASIDEAVINHVTSYRLRVGPELDKKKAEAMQTQLEKQHQLHSLLVSE